MTGCCVALALAVAGLLEPLLGILLLGGIFFLHGAIIGCVLRWRYGGRTGLVLGLRRDPVELRVRCVGYTEVVI